MARFLQRLPKEVSRRIRGGADNALVALERKVTELATGHKWLARHRTRKQKAR